jgi:hypothetical protein
MSSSITFVVEGQLDAVLLKKVLPDIGLVFRFFAGGGRASLATVARNVWAHIVPLRRRCCAYIEAD